MAGHTFGVHAGLVLAGIQSLYQGLYQFQFKPLDILLQPAVAYLIESAGFTAVGVFCQSGSAAGWTGG